LSGKNQKRAGKAVCGSAPHTATIHYLPRKGKNRQAGKDGLTIFLSGEGVVEGLFGFDFLPLYLFTIVRYRHLAQKKVLQGA